MTEQTEQNKQPMSARILRHIADLHEAGIIANHKDEREIWTKYYNEEITEAECLIADLSRDAHNSFDWDADKNECEETIAKNQRRLAWMRQHKDPTKTPLELWEAAKRSEKDGENEHE